MTASYLALAEVLEANIAGLESGARLPSEHELCADRGVSRVTARSALQELERRHLVRRTRGSGTFAALRIPYVIRPDTPPSWSQIIRTAGHRPSYRILRVEHVEAGADASRALLLTPGTPVMQVERVGLIDGDAAAHQLMHFRLDCLGTELARPEHFEKLLGEHSSTTVLLAQLNGVHLERSATMADLRPIDVGRAAELDLTGRPMTWHVKTSNRCGRSHGRVEYSESWLRADSFEVSMEFGPTDAASPFTTDDYERFP